MGLYIVRHTFNGKNYYSDFLTRFAAVNCAKMLKGTIGNHNVIVRYYPKLTFA